VAGDDRVGLLVFRSLTKTWALAGLRAGYALGAPQLLARLAAPRPSWPVSTPALEAVIACSEPAALARARSAADALAAGREQQAAALAAVPGVTVLPGRAPYLLLRLPAGRGERVRTALRAAGIAVRRGDTFPGLDADHLRVAVRPPEQVQRLVVALAGALAAAAAA
jgi:histidinol-phosphate aminotransferase